MKRPSIRVAGMCAAATTLLVAAIATLCAGHGTEVRKSPLATVPTSQVTPQQVTRPQATDSPSAPQSGTSLVQASTTNAVRIASEAASPTSRLFELGVGGSEDATPAYLNLIDDLRMNAEQSVQELATATRDAAATPRALGPILYATGELADARSLPTLDWMMTQPLDGDAHSRVARALALEAVAKIRHRFHDDASVYREATTIIERVIRSDDYASSERRAAVRAFLVGEDDVEAARQRAITLLGESAHLASTNTVQNLPLDETEPS